MFHNAINFNNDINCMFQILQICIVCFIVHDFLIARYNGVFLTYSMYVLRFAIKHIDN